MKTWLRDLLRLAGWFPWLSRLALLFSFTAALLEGIGLAALLPVLSASLVDSADPPKSAVWWLPEDSAHRVLYGIVVFVVMAVAASASRFLAETLLLRLRSETERRAREEMGRALMQMSWPAFVSMRLGDIAQAQLNEGQQLGVAAHLVVQALGASLASAAYLAIALSISIQMTLYVLGFGIVVVVLYRIIGPWARRHADELSSLASSIGERVTDIFHGLKFIRATGMSKLAENKASELYEKWRFSYFASQLYTIGLRQGFEILGLVFIAVFLLMSLRGGAEELPTALVFLAVFYRVAPRLLAAQDALHQARSYHSWYLTWTERLKIAAAARETPTASAEPTLVSHIELRQACYLYPATNRPALDNISVTFRVGESYAIVGGSGSGKSTVLDLLTGLLEPTSGAVHLDDKDLRSVDLQSWRQRIGLVPQEPLLIHGTVLENITWGAPAVDPEIAVESARQAGALPFIQLLPFGIHTSLAEKGGSLSGGQRQRIALARALYRHPDLLLLDEPTSALDMQSQREVLTALSAIKGSCTMIIVTHNRDVASLCDHVITLEGGQISSVETPVWPSSVSG